MILIPKAPYRAEKIWILRPVPGGHQKLACILRDHTLNLPDAEWDDLVQGLIDLFGNGAEAWSSTVLDTDLCFTVHHTAERPKADKIFIQRIHAKKQNTTAHVGQGHPPQPFELTFPRNS